MIGSLRPVNHRGHIRANDRHIEFVLWLAVIININHKPRVFDCIALCPKVIRVYNVHIIAK